MSEKKKVIKERISRYYAAHRHVRSQTKNIEKLGKRLHLTKLGVKIVFIILLFVILVGIFLAVTVHNKSYPKDIVVKVNNLESHDYCYQGIPQISSYLPKLLSGSYYSITEKEAGLKYLMSCNFLVGNKTKAITYGYDLSNLYRQQDNSSMVQNTDQFITYMQNYGH
jgi:hypothetical protein